jgi:adenosylhomocysteine nucleosidase
VTGYLVDALEKVLQENMIPFRRGSLLCTNDPITLPEAKAAAWQQSGALAVDLESAGAAEAAARAGLPFFVFRVVCDPAGRRLVRELFAGVDSQGNSCPAHLLKPLARRPWLLVSLCRMARDFSVALASMERVWRVIRQPLVEQASSRISGPDL